MCGKGPSIPKHSFITWLVILDRLPTKSRMVNWGIQIDPGCLLCDGFKLETRDHLVGDCAFSTRVWHLFVLPCKSQWTQRDWSASFNWVLQFGKGKSMRAAIMRLAWRELNYYVWKERNNRLHEKQSYSANSVFEQIKHDINLYFHSCGLSFDRDIAIN